MGIRRLTAGVLIACALWCAAARLCAEDDKRADDTSTATVRQQADEARRGAMMATTALAAGETRTSASGAMRVERNWIRSEIYFGTAIPGGGQVSRSQFRKFLDQVVTKSFPAGLTVYQVYGQMEDSSGKIIKQETAIVEIIHPPKPGFKTTIDSVISEYRSRFKGAQAMYLQSPTTAEFFTE